MSAYNKQRNIAESNGWPVPKVGSDMDTQPGWRDAWVRYWRAMERYTALKATDPKGDHGRPVQPHRSGGGTPSGEQFPQNRGDRG